MIEQIVMKKTLKAGETIWEEGKILTSPLPEILLEEIELQTGTVEVLKKTNNEKPGKLVFVAKKVEGEEETTTTTSQSKSESGAVLKSVPPPKQLPKEGPMLARRKKR